MTPKYFLVFILSYFFIACAIAPKKEYKLPNTWDKNFSITLYEGGGMAYESTNILFSLDSCKYVQMNNGVYKIKRFKLSAKEREEVLLKLNSFNVGTIETAKVQGLIHDKETNQICFITKPQSQYCIETGATTQIKEKYQQNFNLTYSYLTALAISKTNPQ